MDNPQSDLDQANHDLQNHMEDHLKEEVDADLYLDEVQENEQRVEFLSIKLAIHEGEYDGPDADSQLTAELEALRESGQISATQQAKLMEYWKEHLAG